MSSVAGGNPNNRIGSKPSNVSSHSQLLTDGPLNTYQDFRNVFNVKHLGPKSTRRQAHPPAFLSSDNLRENEERSIRSSSHSIAGAVGANSEGIQKGGLAHDQQAVSARERVIRDRESKRRAEQLQHEQELQRIRDDNQVARAEAKEAHKNQYRTSIEQKASNPKKIEESYSMFDEQQVDEELEDIIEQPIEEESGEGDSDDDFDEGIDAGLQEAMAESKAQRMLSKEELMKLKTQVLEMKEELARKTNKIETIRDTLKVNKVKVESRKSGRVFDIEASLDDREIDEAVK